MDELEDFELHPRRLPHKVTAPRFPELLAQQTRSFEPKQRPAAFPSLPLGKSLAPTTAQANRAEPASCDVIEDDQYVHSLAEIDLNWQNQGVLGKETPSNWALLALSLQCHIYNCLFEHVKSHVEVARRLELTQEEHDEIQHNINLRAIYPADTDHISQYSIAATLNAQDILYQNVSNQCLNYAAFASLYDYTTGSELAKAKHFLEQKNIDPNIIRTIFDFNSSGTAYQNAPRYWAPAAQVLDGKDKQRPTLTEVKRIATGLTSYKVTRKARKIPRSLQLHPSHKPLAFADHFNNPKFPTPTRLELLRMDPLQMNAYQSRLVYKKREDRPLNEAGRIRYQMEEEAFDLPA